MAEYPTVIKTDDPKLEERLIDLTNLKKPFSITSEIKFSNPFGEAVLTYQSYLGSSKEIVFVYHRNENGSFCGHTFQLGNNQLGYSKLGASENLNNSIEVIRNGLLNYFKNLEAKEICVNSIYCPQILPLNIEDKTCALYFSELVMQFLKKDTNMIFIRQLNQNKKLGHYNMSYEEWLEKIIPKLQPRIMVIGEKVITIGAKVLEELKKRGINPQDLKV